jgi:hypothetical protein
VANPYRGEVAVRLGGQDYTLRLDNNAVCEVEQLLGGGSIDVLLSDKARLGRSFVRAVFTMGLRASGVPGTKTIALERVGEMLGAEQSRYGEFFLAALKLCGLALSGSEFEAKLKENGVDLEAEMEKAKGRPTAPPVATPPAVTSSPGPSSLS